MRCIIVDDNQLARTSIKLLLNQFDFLKLEAECCSAVEAFNVLKMKAIDLVFLDVEMPGMTGLELIKNLDRKPIIILITANKEYAVEAFELNVADFLIKPVNLTRFTMAVARAKELFDTQDQVVSIAKNEKNYIFVRHNSMLTKISLSSIIYIQALGDYVNIFTADKRYTIHCTLRFMEEKLPESKFYRLHRSHLVAVDQIDKIEDNTVYLANTHIPIGEQYKKELLRKLNLV
jgi:two-component system LytT family response regulator